MSYKDIDNVVPLWDAICESKAKKVAEEPISGFAGEYEEGDDWADEADEVQEPAVYDEWDRVAPQLQELTDIPYYLYQECRHEGMTEEEAVEETLKRFWE
jgi:hypothetical protein